MTDPHAGLDLVAVPDAPLPAPLRDLFIGAAIDGRLEPVEPDAPEPDALEGDQR